MAHELPPLPYDYAALEPVIDKQTMTLHHDMHHGAYVKNLNAAIEKHPEKADQAAQHIEEYRQQAEAMQAAQKQSEARPVVKGVDNLLWPEVIPLGDAR